MQVVFIAVSACVHCGPEPGDSSVMSLVATLRKRLFVARDPLPPSAHSIQVHILPH